MRRSCVAFLAGALFLLVAGCSGKEDDSALQQTIDYGTGKTQVDTYQRLKGQVNEIRRKAQEAGN